MRSSVLLGTGSLFPDRIDKYEGARVKRAQMVAPPVFTPALPCLGVSTSIASRKAQLGLIARPPSPTSAGRPAMDMQRLLIGVGLAILLAGIVWPFLSRIGLGRLPGDIFVQRGGTSFYFPVVTCIIISIALSALLWLFNR
jgi:hypothetical protein